MYTYALEGFEEPDPELIRRRAEMLERARTLRERAKEMRREEEERLRRERMTDDELIDDGIKRGTSVNDVTNDVFWRRHPEFRGCRLPRSCQELEQLQGEWALIRAKVATKKDRGGRKTQPTPMGYLGNFNEHMGKAESEPCKEIWAVWGFKPGSEKLLDFQKDHIKDIAIHILDAIKRDLRGKKAGVRLRLSFEGHVDKATDPKDYGTLDDDRASWVWSEFLWTIKELNKRTMIDLSFGFTKSVAGSSRPYCKDPRPTERCSMQNRRVVICVRRSIENTP